MTPARGFRAILAAALTAWLAMILLGSAPAWAEDCTRLDPDTGGGMLLSAEVLGPEPADCDAATPSPAPVASGGSIGSGVSDGSDSLPPADVVPAAAPTPIAADEVALGGVLNVTGIQYRYTPSMNPAGGDIELSLSVRNTSQSTIDAETVFWVQTPFGNGVGRNATVAIDGLKPGEARAVTAVIEDVGQWAVYVAHASVFPPDEVDGIALSPLVRDATVFAFPWFVMILGILASCSWWGVIVVRRHRSATVVEATA